MNKNARFAVKLVGHFILVFVLTLLTLGTIFPVPTR